MTKRIKGYITIGIVCLFYWTLDSVWAYLSFEYNLKKLIFSEPGSYIDTFFLKVSPYQIVSRLMVVSLFILLGILIIEFMIRRQKDEMARKAQHDTFLTLMDSIDATIFVSEMETHEIIFMNKSLVDTFDGDFTGDFCYKIFRNSTEVCRCCPKRKLIDTSGNPTDVHIWETQNPVTKTWYVNYDRAIKWIDDRIVHLQIATDITQIKTLQLKQAQMDEQLRQAQKMESIGSLAGGIAHDFNNLLYPIMGFSEMLMEDLPQGSYEQENAKGIYKAAKRGSELVNQILAFSRRSDQGKIPIKAQSIVKEALNLSRSTIPTSIEIKNEIEPDCGMIMADPTQIHQVIMNLMTNAYHAVEANSGGEIVVFLKEMEVESKKLPKENLVPGKYVILSVSDTGHGIPPDLVEKIFDPYFTTKERGKGSGLGLAVVHGIIKNHHGAVTVQSTPGKGTCFNVYLPVVDTPEVTEPKSMTKSLPTGTEHVLLVDDEEEVVKLEKLILERLGYKVTAWTSSIEALEVFKANPDAFDLVMTDMTMPNMTGDLLSKEIFQVRPDIPVIICTGFSEQLDKQIEEQIGFKGLLMKPVGMSEMAKMIRSVLDEVPSKKPYN